MSLKPQENENISINSSPYNKLKERIDIKENSICDKCKSINQYLITFSCMHNICSNCIFQYFMSNYFNKIALSSTLLTCPNCQEGQIDLNLDDFITVLNLLLIQKNPNLIKEEKDINDKNKLISDIIKNNPYLTDLQIKEKFFLQRIENEKNLTQKKINQLIKDLNYFLQINNNKIELFKNNMKKIFQIINLSYYNYYSSNSKDKNDIIILKNLVDFNLIINKVDLTELTNSCKKAIEYLENTNKIYNFEFHFEGTEYKKLYEFTVREEEEENNKDPKSQNSDKEKDLEYVTKLIEIKRRHKLVASLLSGNINIYDLNSKELETTINAHKSGIWAMINLSNNLIATGSSDKMIKIFDIFSFENKPYMQLKGHRGTIFCISEIENNKLISCSEDGKIKLWDLELKKCIKTLEDPNKCKIYCLYNLKDYRFIVTGGNDNLIKIWNIQSNYIPDILYGHECSIWCIISISDDDNIIASGSSDSTIKIWDLKNLICIYTIEEHGNTISSLKLLSNNLMISSSWDQTIKIWNLKTKKSIYTIKGHEDIIWDVIQLEDGNLASSSTDGNIIIWSKV